MTQHDLPSVSHAQAPHPRRRDIHHPDRTEQSTDPHAERARRTGRDAQPSTRRRSLRAGMPVALTVLALTAGAATGLAPASGATRTDASPPAVSAVGAASVFGTTTPAAKAMASASLTGAASATAGAVGSTASDTTREPASSDATTTAATSTDEAVTSAQVVLARAEHVTTESLGVPARSRKAVAKSAAELKKLVVARSGDTASRAGERTDLSERGAAADASGIADATTSLTTLLDKAETSAVSIKPAPATPGEILHAQEAKAHKAAAALAKHANDTDAYENGRIPSGDLCEVSFAPGETLRCDAADQLERLDTAYRARFGTHISIRDSYRSYDSQVATKASRGSLAAVPGYSNHGWAVALDINGGVERYGTAQHKWLVANAADFGWENPDWAKADGRKPEAWHWEYSGL